MRKYVVDTCLVIALAKERPDAYEPLRQAVGEGRIELLSTHVVLDELLRYEYGEERARQVLVFWELTRPIATGVFVMNESRIGHARVGGEGVYERLKGPSAKRTGIRDAMTATAAHMDGLPFVTEDRRLRERCLIEGMDALTLDELVARCIQVDTAPRSDGQTESPDCFS